MLYQECRENGMIKQEQLMELRKYRDDKNMTQEQLINCRLPNYLNMKVNNLITLSEKVIARV